MVNSELKLAPNNSEDEKAHKAIFELTIARSFNQKLFNVFAIANAAILTTGGALGLLINGGNGAYAGVGTALAAQAANQIFRNNNARFSARASKARQEVIERHWLSINEWSQFSFMKNQMGQAVVRGDAIRRFSIDELPQKIGCDFKLAAREVGIRTTFVGPVYPAVRNMIDRVRQKLAA